MSPTLEDQERHLLVKVIDRILYKLDELVRPYVHKVGLLTELLICCLAVRVCVFMTVMTLCIADDLFLPSVLFLLSLYFLYAVLLFFLC